MTYDQMCEIVQDVFLRAWPKQAARWDAKHLRDIIYPAVRALDEVDAREAATFLAQDSRFLPTPGAWRQRARLVQQEHGGEKRIYVDCPDCHGRGMIHFSMYTWRDENDVRRWQDVGADMDITGTDARGGLRASYTMGCGCENTSRGMQESVNPSRKREAMQANAAQAAEFRRMYPDKVPIGKAVRELEGAMEAPAAKGEDQRRVQ